MQKDKLKLTDLRVSSFITELNIENKGTVKGGGSETETKTNECNTHAKGCDTAPACTIINDSFDNNGCAQPQQTGPFSACNNGSTVSKTVG